MSVLANQFFSSKSSLPSLPAADPVSQSSMTMKHEIRVGLEFEKALFLHMCSDPGAWVLFPTRGDRWKGWGCCKLKAKELAFCSLFTVEDYSGKQTSKGKFSLRWAEIGQNVIRHKWKKIRKNKEKEPLFTRRGSFLRTASNYTFHIWFTPESFALLLRTKMLFVMLQGETEADANSLEFGGAWHQG